MKKTIYNNRTKTFFEKGDEVINIKTNETYIVEKIVNFAKGVFIETKEGVGIPLTPDIKPTTNTLSKAKIIDNTTIVIGEEGFIKNKKDEIYFAKLKQDAKIPSKDYENGWYDVYACFEEDGFIIQPQTCVMIPTGIISAFDPKYKVSLGERGSTGTNLMEIRAGKIDSGYRGEWFVALSNGGTKPIIISKSVDKVIVTDSTTYYPYAKAICQASLEEVPDVDVVEKTVEEIMAIPSKRGTGKLGSSNK
jgi:dUTP pyrophosphatase